jgi:hypothetical protein
VQTPNGNVLISSLKLGSQVIAYDHNSHKNVVSDVEQFRALKRPVCEYKLSKGGKETVTVEATSDHPFSTENDLYRPIGALALERRRTIAMEHKNPRGISIVAAKYLGEQVVYDLRIRDQHNFIANGILVHNW